MKKLLLATGLFLSFGLIASAQEKKSTVKPATATPAPERVFTAEEQRNKRKLTNIRKERIARKQAVEAHTAPKAVSSKAREVQTSN